MAKNKLTFISTQAPQETADDLNLIAGILGKSRSTVIRTAIEYYLKNIRTIETLNSRQEEIITTARRVQL